MSKHKNYPLHPEQSHMGLYYVRVPIDIHESNKKELVRLRDELEASKRLNERMKAILARKGVDVFTFTYNKKEKRNG